MAVLIGLVALVGSGAAHAQVPGKMNFQGLLLDAEGQPKNGEVTLVFSLYATASGGNALWTETHTGVPVTDGIYDVELGATDPLTSSDFSSAERYLEITVGSEVLTPRRQILVVPYAITANTALDVGGIPAEFVAQVYQHTDFDENGLLNSHPKEGVADIDGDDLANFIDPDNDGDGLSDATEIAQGSDPNQVTATLTGFLPTTLLASKPGIVTVTGTGFDLLFDIDVIFGGQAPRPPMQVTPTSFRVTVDPQPPGIKPVVIISSNGNTLQGTFEFLISNPVIAFVTSTGYLGDLGGLAGADTKCRERATAAGLPLPTTYRAWINDGTDFSRVTADQWGNRNFALVNPNPPNTPIEFATDYSYLVSSATHNTLFNRNEFGATVASGASVWTGGGTSAGVVYCNGWADDGVPPLPPPPPPPSGRIGKVGTGDWEFETSQPCNTSARLYCFKQ